MTKVVGKSTMCRIWALQMSKVFLLTDKMKENRSLCISNMEYAAIFSWENAIFGDCLHYNFCLFKCTSVKIDKIPPQSILTSMQKELILNLVNIIK